MAVHIGMEKRQALLAELRELEKEGKQIEGYADYLQAMTELDALMVRLCRPNSWGVVEPMDAQSLEQLRQALHKSAMAGESYLENVRNAKEDGGKSSLKKGAPAIVSTLQGILAADTEALNHCDPSLELSLPELLESSRAKVVVLGDEEMDRVAGNSNARIPLSIQGPDGKEYRGVFTKAVHTRIGASIQEALKETEDEIETEAGKAEFRTLMDKLRVWLEKTNPGKSVRGGDTGLFLLAVERFTSLGAGRGGYQGRPSFAWNTFRREIGLDKELIDDEVMRSFAKRAVDLRYKHTAEIISLVDLRLPEGSRLDSRNSAMSAAAELLGAPKLLARSTDMRFVDDKGRVQEGTVMDFGKGLDLMRERALFEQVADQPFAGEGTKGLRQLADLQILDYLCGNVDRHAGNLLYETNEKGEIIGIQGIDNDASFGRFAELKEANNRLPAVGDMNCVSKSMADTILKLDPTQLRFMLRGRNLSERELDYAVMRLKDMKIAIREGQKHYKGRPPIGADTEKPFDKGFLRVVSDQEFKSLTMDKMVVDPDQKNLFNEVRQFMKSALRRAREDGWEFDPEAKKNSKEKTLPQRELLSQVHNGKKLLEAAEGAGALVREGKFKIDDLTKKSRGSSPQFDNMVKAAKQLAEMEEKLSRHVREREAQGNRSWSPAEYEQWRRPLERTKESLGTWANAYLDKKMRERHAQSLDQLQGKNPYEQARIAHAKKILEYTQEHQIPKAVPAEDVLKAKEGMGLELRVGGEMSMEEEAKYAMKMLREIHKQHGLEAPEAYKGMSQEAFREVLKAGQDNQGQEKQKESQGPVKT
ncbi:MAG: hypothetical protein IKS05_02740 [Oscillospiraceae bacterium]|nr:hypothetical protein [Oscillospiraceae bacterium]